MPTQELDSKIESLLLQIEQNKQKIAVYQSLRPPSVEMEDTDIPEAINPLLGENEDLERQLQPLLAVRAKMLAPAQEPQAAPKPKIVQYHADPKERAIRRAIQEIDSSRPGLSALEICREMDKRAEHNGRLLPPWPEERLWCDHRKNNLSRTDQYISRARRKPKTS